MADENSTSSSPFSSWQWLAAGGFLLLVVGATIAVIIVSGGNNEPGAAPSTATPIPTVSSSAPPDGSACGLPAENQDIPVRGPDASWEAQKYLLVPSSDEFGPVQGQDPLWPCFAHSPTGALFAAAHFLPRMVALPGYEEFAQAAAVDNTALDSWLAEQNPSTHDQSAGRTGQYVAYRFQSVEPDAVVIDLGLRLSDASIYYRVSLVWDPAADNWKGDLATSQLSAPVVDDLTSFTSWENSDG